LCNYRQTTGGGPIAILDVRNRQRNVVYVYESYSYWDKAKKQPRSKRRLIGKRDPETGEIVPTRRRGGGAGATEASGQGIENSDTETDYRALYEREHDESRAKDRDIVELRRRVASLEIELERCRDRLEEVRRIVR